MYTLIAFKQAKIIDHHHCEIEDAELLIESGLTKQQIINRTLELKEELNKFFAFVWSEISNNR